MDVSFISLTKVLPPARKLLKNDARMVCLIKPQFEAGREKVGKKGVVRDPAVHGEVIRKIIDHAKSIGFSILNLDFSPVKGPEGNIEYLVYLQNHEDAADCADVLADGEVTARADASVDVDAVVAMAHEVLG